MVEVAPSTLVQYLNISQSTFLHFTFVSFEDFSLVLVCTASRLTFYLYLFAFFPIFHFQVVEFIYLGGGNQCVSTTTTTTIKA